MTAPPSEPNPGANPGARGLRFAANLSLLYSERPFLQRFAAAAADGFQAIEIQFPYDTPVAAIRAELDAHQLICVLINVPAGDLMSGGRGLACVSERQHDYRLALAQCIEYAQVLKPQRVNVLPGRCIDPAQRDTCLITLEQNLRETEQALRPLGIQTLFEAINTTDMPGFLVSGFEQAAQLLKRLSDTDIRLQFDIYHMAMMREPVLALLQQSLDKIGHIQFADCPGRHEPGTGELDFAPLFQSLVAQNYKGWVAAEYRPEGPTTSGLGWFRALMTAEP